jgi:tRNA/rRNA methyltransferase
LLSCEHAPFLPITPDQLFRRFILSPAIPLPRHLPMSSPATPDLPSVPLADGAALLRRVRIVLVAPSHPGNIGAAARALKTMGLAQLHLVSPGEPEFATHPEAVALATHGIDLLRAARVHASLPEALAGVRLAFAMTGYSREFGPPLVELRTAAAEAGACLHGGDDGEVAFVFGTERSGLTNADVERCQASCAIPADALHGSLNLAQSVMVTAYECRLALTDGSVAAASRRFDDDPPADVARLEGLIGHMERALVASGFLDPEAPRRLMPRLRRLLARARPSDKEIDILRGIFATLEQPKRERIGTRELRPARRARDGSEPGSASLKDDAP